MVTSKDIWEDGVPSPRLKTNHISSVIYFSYCFGQIPVKKSLKGGKTSFDLRFKGARSESILTGKMWWRLEGPTPLSLLASGWIRKQRGEVGRTKASRTTARHPLPPARV